MTGIMRSSYSQHKTHHNLYVVYAHTATSCAIEYALYLDETAILSYSGSEVLYLEGSR